MSFTSSGLQESAPAAPLERAAEYVRMSTDHQRYSTMNQSAAIHAYAAAHRMDIVRTYTDGGKSGLDLGGREALRRLLEDVQRGPVDFNVILVYDISRWGRFQNPDESAHYEFLCTRAGIRLVYCAEQFENDGTALATIVKNVKRAMAGEYSRELSTKVFAGQCRLVQLGFHQGGTAGYGLRRALIDEQKTFKGELSLGQHKSIQTDRVVLTAGPPEELAVVQRIYADFVRRRLSERDIADALNQEGIQTDLHRPWTRGTVHQVLTNEKYIGNNVYNRSSGKLKTRTTANAPELWVRCDQAFPSIVSAALFLAVRDIVAQRSQTMGDADMLNLLRRLLERAGTLSGLVIDEQDDMPSSTAYQARFGGLLRAYALVDYQPDRDYRYLATNRLLREWRPQVVQSVIAELERWGGHVAQNATNDLLTVNDEWTASIVLARCQETGAGALRWKIRFDTGLRPDLTVVVRMARANDVARDYYLLPSLDAGCWPGKLHEDNAGLIDSYRFDGLSVLSELAARRTLAEVA